MLDMKSFISKVDSKKGAQDIIAMQKNVFMYGSEKTVIILSEMMQYFYTREDDDEGYRAMTFVAFLICSLKYDFTGYEIDPITILKIKITDIDIEKLSREKKYVETVLDKYDL
ncbi:hypothetical protein [Lactococcus garvieae]|uniref:hypothetical protein n=1 Tax=Lactococcus garvieae TaxID=1363 RepID=UPI0030CFA3CC